MAYRGLGTSVKMKKESTPGTAVTPDRLFEVISASISEPVALVPRSSLNTVNSSAPSAQSFLEGPTSAAGQISFEVGYKGLGMILEAITGGTPSTSGSGPYTHTYALDATPAAYTVELGLGSSGNAETFAGMYCNKVALIFEVGTVARLDTEWIGHKSTGSRTTGTGSLTTSTAFANAVAWSELSSFTWNSSTLKARKVTITLDRKMEPRHKLGDTTTPDSVIAGTVADLSISVEWDYDSDDFWTAMRAGTVSDLVIGFTSGSMSFTVTAHNCRVNEEPMSFDTMGVIAQTTTFYPTPDATDTGLAIVVVNDQSSATAV